jgi:predicted peptidase
VRRFLWTLLLWSAPATQPAAGQDRVVTDTIVAPSLGQRAVYRVVLPEGYDSAFRYPVLWLLHGGDGTGWLRETELTRDLQRYPIVVVLPSVKNSFYVNSWADPTSRYEDFVVRDLHDDVVRRYAVDTLREGIAGLSMGGYGALMLALRYPRRFRFAGLEVRPLIGERLTHVVEQEIVYGWIIWLETSGASGRAPARSSRSLADVRTKRPTAPSSLDQPDPFLCAPFPASAPASSNGTPCLAGPPRSSTRSTPVAVMAKVPFSVR